jgi:hypothetical protein
MRFGYARVVLPNDEDSVRLAYDFDVRHLYFNHQPEGRVWVLGIMAESMGTPVAVRMPERPVAPVTDGGVPAPAAAEAPAPAVPAAAPVPAAPAPAAPAAPAPAPAAAGHAHH